ncbi:MULTISPECIES: kanosamine kinase [unclassified Amycolatopsis]|uniref:kanosamine kinase n=1 Tax=unclassified Amycolatopsis TaxID=2618356 RepID=UPI00287411C3|nr:MULTISPECIES: kanosamine kinase [unclassified Amycolatopsis]MDS0132448.1 ROK family protein [Amycolatopsis sp. 505]MDS0142728.1 ROK family protein [Amycolatopsis sp. CM201R]
MRTPYHLGIDVGGTKVAFRVETGTACVEETSFGWGPRHRAEADLAQLAAHVAGLRDRLGGPLEAVGVAMPGTVGPDGRVVTWPSRPEWTDVDLKAVLHKLFPEAAVAWADDGDLGALAEAQASGCENLLYVGIGTGIGGGLVLGGVPCPGLGRGSFEIGHVLVEPDGARCVCGRRGCLQALASGPATLRRAEALRGADVTFDDLREAVRGEQPWAIEAIDTTARALAAAVTSVQELVHPERALLGGGFAAGFPSLTGRVAAHLGTLARPGLSPLPLAPAALGGLSSLRGAVALARLIAGGSGERENVTQWSTHD